MTVIHVLEPFASGVTTALVNLTRELSDIKHVVVHGSRTGADGVENARRKFSESVSFIVWPCAHREINLVHDGKALGALVDILRPYRKTADTVVHLHSSKAGFLGRMACKRLHIKRVIYTPHGASFIRTDIGLLSRMFYYLLERVGGLFGGMIVGCGESEAALYRKMAKTVTFVSNGTPSGDGSARAEKLAPPLVVFAGLANRQKNPALFNAIALGVKERVPAARFCWVGDGPRRGELNAANVEVTGWVGKDAVDTYLGESLVYLSTSSWEGLPYGVIEAMNAGCALLVSDIAGNRDLVQSGENGFAFKTAAEAVARLEEMLAAREKTLAMGERSRVIAETEFSAKKMGEGYRALYTALCGQSN